MEDIKPYIYIYIYVCGDLELFSIYSSSELRLIKRSLNMSGAAFNQTKL